LLSANAGLLFIRVWQRYYFVSKLNGRLQGLLSIPRLFVNNLINFCAVCRAWRIYIRHLVTRKPIAWDKTAHTFLSNEAMGKARRKLGEILIDWGALTQEKLDTVLALQAECGRKLGELLLEQAFILAETLADALAEQSELPRVSLENVAADLCAGALPYELQHAYTVVPFSISEDGTLNCAVGNPLTQDEQSIIRRGAGTKVAYFIAADTELKSQLRKHIRYDELERASARILPFIDPQQSAGPGVA
jgi:bacteriophage N4 adsorption protein B